MTTIRWLTYIPAAFVASVVLGAVVFWFANFFAHTWLDAGPWIAWVASGLGSAFGFIAIGLRIAPVKSSAVKWSLIVPVFLLGALSAVGALVAGDDKLVALSGAAMVLVAVGAIRTPVDVLGLYDSGSVATHRKIPMPNTSFERTRGG